MHVQRYPNRRCIEEIPPPLAGVEAVAEAPGLSNPKGFIPVDAYHRHKEFTNVCAVGVALPPVEEIPVPVNFPKTGHIPGALNMPLEEIEQHLADLPKEQEVIAYCRGEYCVLAFEAVAALRNKGFQARRLEEGYPEWKAAGLPVEGIEP